MSRICGLCGYAHAVYVLVLPPLQTRCFILPLNIDHENWYFECDLECDKDEA